MKLPTFNHNEMCWDAWKAFHVEHKRYTFVQFDTGEFVVCRNSWRPDERKVYRDLHIQIVSTADRDCPRLYIPGSAKPVPKSHLNHKQMQMLLLDLDHKRAVGLWPGLTIANAPLVPRRFTKDALRHVNVWYAGPDALPVGGPIIRHYPQPLTQEQRVHIKELGDACKVWLQMQPPVSDPNELRYQHHDVQRRVDYFTETPFAALTTKQRTAIALRGFNNIIKEEHSYLTFESAITFPTFDDDVK